MKSVSAILLAAGESRRMGKPNKLELDANGISLLRRTAKILLESELQEVVVVVGHEADKTKSLISGLPLKIVMNDDYQKGQMSSVHKGLESLTQESDGVMICLSDQPLLESSDINIIIEAFENRSSGSVLVPTYQGQRGNPIILAQEQRSAILNGQKNLGCRRLIEKNPELVTSFEMDNNHVVFDLDTPEDYAAFQQNSNQKSDQNKQANNK
ncbi:hypothetical protein GCM10009133_25090 [Cocleimonas flava]|uniref:Molybdenum cofactor cytidylyltransferase n=1 Tax=Cocleimonas flava TaxID=634765 RepID=A0A4R1EPV6_9GAMM|nr:MULTISPECIES: nucleotidyltransferase family protein [Cocleimonas]MEB8432633.1 nucleotidyltransferase family protein [Cocleimonas sp. KMM 6892]MEC4715492.1 nucleotidyltransferase family protein [Cocleimonas sp. KMM 6895]MEC4744890.1 nucleotidyltransferase family protein [Cocleimonas sp. KMM 6896]TCJ83043.1 molybdenum cofactor cytidylyltransferase [Cocleimonas flava]